MKLLDCKASTFMELKLCIATQTIYCTAEEECYRVFETIVYLIISK